MNRVLRVGAWPAFRKAHENRYSAQFAESLADSGVEIHEFSPSSALRRYDVVLVHWPEIGLNRERLIERLAAIGITLAALTFQRLRGTMIVWVTHNLRPHDDRSPRLGEFFYRALTRVVTGLIHPSLESRRQAEREYPRLSHIESMLAPHGMYPAIEVDAAKSAEVLERFGLISSDVVLLSFGQIRPYKGVPDLLVAVRDTPAPNVRVVIAGACTDEELGREIRQLASSDERVRLSLEHQDESTLAVLLERTDLVVLPFRDVLNSGTVIHTLSARRRVLCPFIGSLAELAEQVGPSWMRAIDAPLTSAQLEAAIEWSRAGHPGPRPTLPDADWGDIGRATTDWIQTLVERRHSRRR